MDVDRIQLVTSQIQAGADVPSQQARMQAAAARRFAELVIGFSISRLPWTAGP